MPMEIATSTVMHSRSYNAGKIVLYSNQPTRSSLPGRSATVSAHANPTPPIPGRRLLSESWLYHCLYPYFWQCPPQVLSAWVNKHLHDHHLQVGCDASLILTRALNSSPMHITLMEPEHTLLRRCQQRLPRCILSSFQYELTAAPEFGGRRFNSIGIGDSLSRVSGSPEQKLALLTRLQPHLSEQGIMFGWVKTGESLHQRLSNRSQQSTAAMENSKAANILSRSFHETGLRQYLNQRFNRVMTKRVGAVVLFAASQ